MGRNKYYDTVQNSLKLLAKHGDSLQLLYTVGSNQAKPCANATKFLPKVEKVEASRAHGCKSTLDSRCTEGIFIRR